MSTIAKHPKLGGFKVKLSDDSFHIILFSFFLWYFPMLQQGGKYAYLFFNR